MSDDSADRRAALLQAATGVFLRYGYRKTSMDAIAQAAGLSRQGLYLWFRTKEALFREAVEALQAQAQQAFAEALADEQLSLPDRLAAAFDAAHGPFVGARIEARHLAELVETANALLGTRMGDSDRALQEQISQAIATAGLPARLGKAGPSAEDLAQTVQALAVGNKHIATDRADYRRRMALGLRTLFRS